MQRSNKVALFGAALGVCVLLTSCIPAQADAQQILTAAFTAGNRLPKLADGEFRVVSYTIEKPTNDQSMAKDPYHLADSPLVTETNWIRFDGAIRFERRDAKINALLDMIQITEGKMRSIDGASGVIFDSTLDISSSVSLSQTSNAIPQQFDIRDGRVESIDTGTPEIQAWRITTPADAAILSSLQMELPQMGLRTIYQQPLSAGAPVCL